MNSACQGYSHCTHFTDGKSWGSESTEAHPRTQEVVGWALNPGLSSSRAQVLVHSMVWGPR